MAESQEIQNPSLRVARHLTTRFREICHENGEKFDDNQIDAIEEEFSEAVRDYLRQKNSEIFQEVRKIALQLEETKNALTGPAKLGDNPLSTVQSELGAVLAHNEKAADTILSSCEAIQEQVASAEMENGALDFAAVTGSINEIFEACDFQDLSGQRLTKVIDTLHFVEDTVGNLVQLLAKQVKAEAQTEAEMLRNGPGAEAVSQEDIDALFDMF